MAGEGESSSGDRREIDKLRAQLETERFAALKELIETKFDALNDRFDTYESALEEHLKKPHSLADLATTAAAIPQPPPNGTARDEQGFWRTVTRNWKFVALLLSIPAVGSTGYVFHGCGPLAGAEIRVHDVAAMTAAAQPTPTKVPR